MNVAANEQQILDDFLFIENPSERLGAIVDATRHLPHFPEEDRTDARHVPGCTSKVWLIAHSEDDRWRFQSDCDSPLVRALVHQLCRAFDGVSTQEAATAQTTVLEKLGVTQNLTPTRLNGLAAVRERIAALATGAV
jgi:cysteine desulfuration protein SufE